jgi:uncharacterized protein (DUF305 family)
VDAGGDGLSLTTVTDMADAAASEQAPGRSLRTLLLSVMLVAVLAIAGGLGYLVGDRNAGRNTPSATSVDAGFAWDMAVHHRQAVDMAGYTRDHTTDPAIKNLAFDIETSQFNQVGQMQGWLDAWGLPVNNPNAPMAWMAGSGHDHIQSNGLMPGMASTTEVAQLETMTGKALDVRFLQLMLRHHQGGLPMAQWGAEHATTDYVRNSAQKMVAAQSAEVLLMEQLLRERGASPLPPPD